MKGDTLYMSTQLTPEERDQRIVDNIKLVYHMVQQLPHINPNNYDDLVQIGRIGLIKAVSTFDETKGTKFATYASRCINNEIYMYFRKERTYNSDISLNEVIYTGKDGENLELEDILGNEDDFVDEIGDEEVITNVLSIILNVMEPKEAIAMLYKISGIYTQREIGKSLGLSQSYVSRLKEKAEQHLRRYFEIGEKINSPFFMAKVGKVYRFTCDTQYLNECLAEFLQNKRDSISLYYKVVEKNGRIELWMPSDSETFVFIAEFIKEVYNF